MKTHFCLSIAACCFIVGCGGKSEKPAQSLATTNGSSPTETPAGYLGGLVKGQQKAVKTVDTASLIQAIQLFNVDKGRNPKDLNELVQEKYIQELPSAPFGMKLDYDPNSGKVTVTRQQ